MEPEPRCYHSYLIRIWEADTNEHPTLRASLERPGCRKRLGFLSLDELIEFIREDVSKDASGADQSEGFDQKGGEEDKPLVGNSV